MIDDVLYERVFRATKGRFAFGKRVVVAGFELRLVTSDFFTRIGFVNFAGLALLGFG